MPDGTTTAGQILAASTTVGAALAAWLAASENKLAMVLAAFSGVIGAIVLLSFVGTRLLRKFI